MAGEFRARPKVDQSLSMRSLDQAFEPFVLPATLDVPNVSVIIPVHGKLAYTLNCLRSLADHPTAVPLEIIVVDDDSPDDSAAVLEQVQGLRVLRNPVNLGFVASCNAGAGAARGEYLYFLNNDTQVTPGWLNALLACFAEEPDCALAGSRLVYPDGRLQEAGGVVYADGSCWNVGRFESREEPAYRFRRAVDYVSGASMLIRRATFEQAGGFDTRYAPAYYEDVDLAFAVRQLGRKVFYEPRSMVIHFEGISAGRDLDAGMKQHQKRNQLVFVEKWRAALMQQCAPGTPVAEAVARGTRGHILIVDASTPDPSRDSGSLRLTQILHLLHQDGYRLSFLPDDGRCTSEEADALGSLGVEVLRRPWTRNLPHWLERHGRGLHAVMLCRHAVAGQYAQVVRRYAPQATLIFDTVDLHFLREQRAAELTGRATMQRQASASRRSEFELIERCDITFVVSTHERDLLRQELPQARVELLSNIHEVHGRGAAHAGRRDVVFIGGYGHPPNADAIHWIAEALLPVLRLALPGLCVHVLGDVPEGVRDALSREGLQLHGRVADLAPWLDGCLASIAPLRFGAGVKGKINMAMSHGVPVVATNLAVEGMHLEDGRDVLLAEQPAEFAAAILRLQQEPALWLALSEASLRNVERHFSPAAARATLRRALDRARS